MAGVESCLAQLVELGGGDLHLSPGQPSRARARGELRALEGEPAPKDVGELLLKIAPPEHRKEFGRTGSVRFASEYGDLGRFRVQVFRERLGTAAIARLILGEVASFEELRLPDVARDLCSRRWGLVVVAGPAGAGKTTTLAALVDQGAGARVTAVGEPNQALAEIATGSFDLAMFDILMPEMSGTDLYDRALKLTSALKERVVFVTGCRLDGRRSCPRSQAGGVGHRAAGPHLPQDVPPRDGDGDAGRRRRSIRPEGDHRAYEPGHHRDLCTPPISRSPAG